MAISLLHVEEQLPPFCLLPPACYYTCLLFTYPHTALYALGHHTASHRDSRLMVDCGHTASSSSYALQHTRPRHSPHDIPR